MGSEPSTSNDPKSANVPVVKYAPSAKIQRLIELLKKIENEDAGKTIIFSQVIIYFA